MARGIEVIEFACGIPHLLKGEFSEDVSTGVDASSVRQPLGVVAGITPFNFPVMVPMWMYPVAIACGNAFILKPSERDPSPSLLVADLWREAGLPEGVFTVVNGDSVAVDALLDHPERGRGVLRRLHPGGPPRLRTGHGGRQAVPGPRRGQEPRRGPSRRRRRLRRRRPDRPPGTGRPASAAWPSRPWWRWGTATRLVRALAGPGRGLTTGPGTDPGSDMGPLITARPPGPGGRLPRLGRAEGAEVVLDGREVKVPGRGRRLLPRARAWSTGSPRPWRSTATRSSGRCCRCCGWTRWTRPSTLVNANPYGNGTAIFTRDGHAARRFRRDVQVGMVGINVAIPVPMAYYSFGGWKESLFGDAHIHGMEGVRFNTRLKSVTTRWPGPTAPAPGDGAEPGTIELHFPSGDDR